MLPGNRWGEGTSRFLCLRASTKSAGGLFHVDEVDLKSVSTSLGLSLLYDDCDVCRTKGEEDTAGALGIALFSPTRGKGARWAEYGEGLLIPGRGGGLYVYG